MAAKGIEEKIQREERARRIYYCGRFGKDAKLEEEHWNHYDNKDVSALHNYRSVFALGLPNYGIPEFRAKRAAGIEEPPPPPPVPKVRCESYYDTAFQFPARATGCGRCDHALKPCHHKMTALNERICLCIERLCLLRNAQAQAAVAAQLPLWIKQPPSRRRRKHQWRAGPHQGTVPRPENCY
jgi:hypothetical protein